MSVTTSVTIRALGGWETRAFPPDCSRKEHQMKKIFAAFALVGIVLGAATMFTSAQAAFSVFGTQGENQGSGS